MKPAILALANGTIFHGRAIGAIGESVGEVVFNTSMTGYQEILSDPSYAGQLITLTYPHIGNVGCNQEDMEADKIWAKGLIVKDLPIRHENYRSESSLSEFLIQHGVVAISDIDTRHLTRILREEGAQGACLQAGEINEARAVSAAKSYAGLAGQDLAKVVTTPEKYEWSKPSFCFDDTPKTQKSDKHIVAYDFGAKHNILRLLSDRFEKVTVVPATTSADEALSLNPDGIFLSNGPGDPAPCDYAISAIKTFIERKIPIFGICLGHQLLALAAGAKTLKMKFGHHGANHPVRDESNGVVMITSQNHGFAVDESCLPDHIEVTHRSLFDKTVQGIRLKNAPAYSAQGHPEASPGPHDMQILFDEFVTLIDAQAEAAA